MPLIIGDKPVDMICQFTRDCEIIPIKFRLEGKDGELQEYKKLWIERSYESRNRLYLLQVGRIYRC